MLPFFGLPSNRSWQGTFIVKGKGVPNMKGGSGIAPAHPPFLEIRAFALESKQGQGGHSALVSHIQECGRCKATYDNICKYDPELNPEQRISAAQLWEGVWQEFGQSRLPGDQRA